MSLKRKIRRGLVVTLGLAAFPLALPSLLSPSAVAVTPSSADSGPKAAIGWTFTARPQALAVEEPTPPPPAQLKKTGVKEIPFTTVVVEDEGLSAGIEVVKEPGAKGVSEVYTDRGYTEMAPPRHQVVVTEAPKERVIIKGTGIDLPKVSAPEPEPEPESEVAPEPEAEGQAQPQAEGETGQWQQDASAPAPVAAPAEQPVEQAAPAPAEETQAAEPAPEKSASEKTEQPKAEPQKAEPPQAAPQKAEQKKATTKKTVQKKPAAKAPTKSPSKSPSKSQSTSTPKVSSSAEYSLKDFLWMGVINWNGYKFTYYSQSVLPGGGLSIPGRHVNSGGYVSDGDGYIVLAGSAPKGTVYQTPFGWPGKIYDRGTSGNHLDVYVQ